jgi:hypothetical protein
MAPTKGHFSSASSERATQLGGAPDLFHALLDLPSGLVGHFERHIGYSTAALQGSFHGNPHHVTLNGCKVLRSSAGPQLVHVVHVLLDLMSNHLEVLSRHSADDAGSSGARIKQRLRVARCALRCLLRTIS